MKNVVLYRSKPVVIEGDFGKLVIRAQERMEDTRVVEAAKDMMKSIGWFFYCLAYAIYENRKVAFDTLKVLGCLGMMIGGTLIFTIIGARECPETNLLTRIFTSGLQSGMCMFLLIFGKGVVVEFNHYIRNIFSQKEESNVTEQFQECEEEEDDLVYIDLMD